MATTTTSTVTLTPQFDIEYLRTLPGKLKLIQVSFAISGFIIYMIMYSSCAGSWFSTVTIVSFTFSGILLLFYLFHIIEWLKKINWLLMEMIYCTLFFVLYLVGSIILCTCFWSSALLVIPALLGLFNAFAYGTDAYLKFIGWRHGEDVIIATSEPEVIITPRSGAVNASTNTNRATKTTTSTGTRH